MSGERFVNRAGWIALALFLTTYALDCMVDIRGRDCFTWMDPAQYFSFAAAVAKGGAARGGFEVASAFPFYVAPFLVAGGETVPAALASNILSALVLAGVVLLLARLVGIRSPGVIPVVLVLSAPLLVGLSRELYVEYTLSWMVGLGYVLWFRSERLRRPILSAAFALFFAAGLLVKMTMGVFFVGPLLFEAAAALRARRPRRLAVLGAAFLLPGLLVFGGVRLFFPDSFAYYASLGNTRIPIMRFIGPSENFTAASLLYYPFQLARSVFGFASIFFLAPLLAGGRLLARTEGEEGRSRRTDLLLWLVAPIVLFTFQAVKEPRHIAPVAIPAALLVVAAFDRVRRRRLRKFLFASALLLAVGQYLLLTRGVLFCPYRLAEGLSPARIEEAMVRADPEKALMRSADGRLDINRWRFTRSIALSGFDPNEALALGWWFAPAVVYDLDLPQWDDADGRAYRRFEDLFYFSALNIYNARCNWPGRTFTLDRASILRRADFVLARGSEDHLAASFPDHEPFAVIDGRRPVHLLAPRERSPESYRDLYARAFLARSRPADARELNTIYFSLYLDSFLRGETPSRASLLEGFPSGFRPGGERRNIFWIAHDFPLVTLARDPFARHLQPGS